MSLFTATPEGDDKYAKLVYSREIDDSQSYHFSGSPVQNWEPMPFKWHINSGKNESDLVFNDVVSVFGAGMDIAVNQKAKDVIKDTLNDKVEFLPIEVLADDSNWYLLNIINIIPDALNNEKSEFRQMRSGKRGPLKKAVFSESNIPDNTAFVFPESPRRLMVNGEFLKNALENNGVTGLNFYLYQSEALTKAS